MITREQVADLQPGDVVEFRIDEWDAGQAIRGPLTISDTYTDVLEVRIPGGGGQYWIRSENGRPFDPEHRTLTVLSRAPRPLYVNHPRTEPVPGDVVRVASDATSSRTWHYLRTPDGGYWHSQGGQPQEARPGTGAYDRGLRLLVDGERGQVVQ